MVDIMNFRKRGIAKPALPKSQPDSPSGESSAGVPALSPSGPIRLASFEAPTFVFEAPGSDDVDEIDDDEEFPRPTGFVFLGSDEEWAVEFVPNMFPRGFYDAQGRIAEWSTEHAWVEIEIFRGSGKTFWACVKIARCLLDNPEETVGLFCENVDKAKSRLRTVRNILTSDRVIAKYGYMVDQGLKKKRKGADKAFEIMMRRKMISPQPSLMALAWGGSAQGNHFSVILFDDVWSAHHQASVKKMVAFKIWYAEFHHTLEDCKRFIMLRTRKGVEDAYAWLDREYAQWHLLRVPLVRKWPAKNSYSVSIDEWGIKNVTIHDQAGWDEMELSYTCLGKFTKEKVVVLRDQNPTNFETEMQNNPVLSAGLVFKWDQVMLYDESEIQLDPITADVVAGRAYEISMLDLALGQSEGADFSAICVMARHRFRYYIRQLYVGKWTYAEREAILQGILQQYPKIRLYCEEDFGQLNIVVAHELKLKSKFSGFVSRGKGKKLQTLYEGTTKAAKKAKIHIAFEPVLATRSLYVNTGSIAFDNFRTQLVGFPNPVKFDVIDAVAMALLQLYKPARAIRVLGTGSSRVGGLRGAMH